jgi:gas vesicle protein
VTNQQTTHTRDFRFVAGLAIGSMVGAGLALLLAPRAAAEIKERAVGSARHFGDAVSERYRDARLRVTGAVDGLTRKGQGVRDGVMDTVVHGAQEVERGAQGVQRLATDAKAQKTV